MLAAADIPVDCSMTRGGTGTAGTGTVGSSSADTVHLMHMTSDSLHRFLSDHL